MTDELPHGFVTRDGQPVTPGFDGPEGTEFPRRERKHDRCPITEAHPAHGMATWGYSGQSCGGVWAVDLERPWEHVLSGDGDLG